MSITAKPRGNIVNYYTGNGDRTYTNSSDNPWVSLMITNDGVSDLIVTVNSMPITIKASETFDEDFVDFDTVVIAASDSYRILMRQ
jgi:hypothetical protein